MAGNTLVKKSLVSTKSLVERKTSNLFLSKRTFITSCSSSIVKLRCNAFNNNRKSVLNNCNNKIETRNNKFNFSTSSIVGNDSSNKENNIKKDIIEKESETLKEKPVGAAITNKSNQSNDFNGFNKKIGFFKKLKWTLYTIIFGLTGYGVYKIYQERNPIDQVIPGNDKKTLVILGTGWGSISLLKKLDTSLYNVIVISPRNFFLFTPLLPSCPTGTIENRSIMEPVRYITRHKQGVVTYLEAEALSIDKEKRTVRIRPAEHPDDTSISPLNGETDIHFDYLVVGVGAQNSTFGTPGVEKYGCFLKEIQDSQKIRKKIMDRIEQASLPGVSSEEKKRLLHMVVVGGGPTGVEFAAELQDFFEDDLKKWIPTIKDDFKVSLIEALPQVLPMFSKKLVEYTENSFKQEKISMYTKTMVKNVTEEYIEAEVTKSDGTKERIKIPYGLLVWATGNAVRPITKSLMGQIAEQKNSRRGLLVNEYLVIEGTEGMWALGDCTSTRYAPTAQVASQQGNYLASLFNQLGKAQVLEHDLLDLEKLSEHAVDKSDRKSLLAEIDNRAKVLRRARMLMPFEYSHQGSLAYIGMDRAIAELSYGEGTYASGGPLTFLFWRSAYISLVFSSRNRILVFFDWLKVRIFGRDVSRE